MPTPDTRHCGHGLALRIDCAGCALLILRLPPCLDCRERLCPPGRGRCEVCGDAATVLHQ